MCIRWIHSVVPMWKSWKVCCKSTTKVIPLPSYLLICCSFWYCCSAVVARYCLFSKQYSLLNFWHFVNIFVYEGSAAKVQERVIPHPSCLLFAAHFGFAHFAHFILLPIVPLTAKYSVHFQNNNHCPVFGNL